MEVVEVQQKVAKIAAEVGNSLAIPEDGRQLDEIDAHALVELFVFQV